MSNYVKSTDFGAKDSLPSSSQDKKIMGATFDLEFNAVATAIQTKANLASPVFTGTPTAPNPAGSAAGQELVTAKWVRDIINLVEPIGTIKVWAGALVSIPAGWQACDGTNGTLDLRDRFVVGAGTNYTRHTAAGSAAGSLSVWATITSQSGGSHSHGAATGSHALTVSEMPSHLHGPAAGTGFITEGASGFGLATNTSGLQVYAPATGHNANTAASGGGLGHTHSIGADGIHTHAVNGSVPLPPYMPVTFIQKIANV